MNAREIGEKSRSAGLSCYTANLYEYLAVEWPDAHDRMARSIRLAVGVDQPGGALAFSHHAFGMDRLPDGGHLSYASSRTPIDALADITDELDRWGRVLVVVDAGKAPWSPVAGTGASAPHWLLVEGRNGDQVLVRDAFAGLLPAGEQRPFRGWIPGQRLMEALALPPAWTPTQQMRCRYAFGHAVSPPEGSRLCLLRRIPSGASGPDEIPVPLAGTWLTDDGDVLDFLARHFIEIGGDALDYLDDVWAAAMHRTFRYRWLAERAALDDRERSDIDTAHDLWQKLPSALRFAVESAGRGNPRPGLITTTLEHLRSAESAVGAFELAQGREA